MKRTLLFLGIVVTALMSSMPAKAVKVYFNNPNNWTTVKAYFYKGAVNNEWPGVDMAKAAGETLYSVDIPADFLNGNVIFTNGAGAQYPAETGLQLSNVDMVCILADDHSSAAWSQYYAAPVVYFDNSAAKWTTPHIWYWGASTPTGNYPGTEEMELDATLGLWKYTLPAGIVGMKFNDGAAANTQESAEFTPKPDHKYNLTKDLGEVNSTAAPFKVYWNNTSTNWSSVYIHYWGGATESEWPGETMSVEKGKAYSFTVPAGTTNVIFHNNNGTQTADLDAVENHIYDMSGDKGDYNANDFEAQLPANLYILGTVGETFWATTPGIALTKEGSVYTATGVAISPSVIGGKTGYFTLVSAVGANWDAVNDHDRYGAKTEDAELTSGTPADVQLYVGKVDAASAKSWTVTPGIYNISVNLETMKITATRTDEDQEAATGALAIPDVTINPGKDATMEIRIADATVEMTALQLDVEFPSCVEYGAPLISRSMADHTLSYNVVDGKLRIVVFSESNTAFKAANGAILYIPLTAKADAEVSDTPYTITLSDIVFADNNLLPVVVADAITGKLFVQESTVVAGSITLNKTVLALNPGATETLAATVLPAEAAASVTWETDALGVATVDNTGKVTAVAKGTAVITAKVAGTDLAATCTVYVGKKAQTITWDAPLSIQVGESYTLNAASETATAERPVVYTIESGAGLVDREGNVITAKAVGVVTIKATLEGNDEYAPAEPVVKTINITLGYVMGDVTGEGNISLDDVTTTVNYILGKNPTPFNDKAADMNGDTKINVADVALIVDYLLKHPAAPAPAPRRVEGENLEQFAFSAADYSLRVNFSNMEEYCATMFDLVLPDGLEVTSGSMAGSAHSVVFNKNAESTRVIVYSMNNNNFASDGYIDLKMSARVSGEITLGNALVNKNDGQNIHEFAALGVSGTPTAIEAIGADDTQCSVYTIDGVCVFSGNRADLGKLANGLYIVRSGKKVEKVYIR